MNEAEPSGVRLQRVAVAGLLGLHCVPVLTAAVLVLRFAVNVPFIDDYPNLLGFVLRWRGMASPVARAGYVFTAQHDEYRFSLMHLLALGTSAVTGRIDIRLLSVLGDLSLPALLGLLWWIALPRGMPLARRLLVFLPVTYLLFGINYAEGLGWPSATLDYLPVIFFSFLALTLLAAGGRRSFVASCGVAVLAYLTAPNAVVLLPLGLVVLLLRRWWVGAAGWCAAFAVGIAPYLFDYQRAAPAQEGTTARLLVVFFFSFLGSGNPAFRASFVVGVAVVVGLVLAWRWGFYRSHPALTLCALWVVGSGVLVAVGRSHSGVEFATISRYKIFSDTLLIFCYAVFAERVVASGLSRRRQMWVFAAASAVCGVVCLRADVGGYHILREQRTVLLTGLARFRAAPEQVSPMHFPDAVTERVFTRQEGEARELMVEAMREGLYVPPAP